MDFLPVRHHCWIRLKGIDMCLLTLIKLKFIGRDSIANEMARWRRAALKNCTYSFVSGNTENLESHHLFHVSWWPCFALSHWNSCIMTASEHRLHSRSFHSWERRVFKGNISRMLIASTPLGLYIWKYFYWHWWKGLSLVFTAFSLFLIASIN